MAKTQCHHQKFKRKDVENMKKRRTAILMLAGCLCLSTLLTGCNNDLSDKLNSKYETETPPEVTYVVKFNATGGTCIMSEVTVNQNSSIGNLPTPVKDGYEFLGWYDAKENGNEITNASIISNNITIYAHWQEITSENPASYTITFNATGGICDTETITVKENQPINDLPIPKKEGFLFNGWFTEESKGDMITEDTVITNNVTYYAHWIAVTPPSKTTHTITFEPNGGICQIENITVEDNTEIGSLPIPTHEGYRFDGWFSALHEGDKLETNTIITHDATYWAHWSEINETQKHIITLDFNDGTGHTETCEVQDNEPIGFILTPTRENYEFLGWFSTPHDGTQLTEETIITHEATYYAHWKSTRTFTVSFNLNGGQSNNAGNRTIKENEPLGELPNATRNGYTFKGWFTAASGGTQINENTIVTANITYYAQWNYIEPGKPTYTVTLNANSGSCGTNNIQVQQGGNYSGLPSASKTGYDFSGWYTAAVGGTKITSASSLVTNANHTLYAHYKNKIYTISYDMNGANNTINDVSKKHGVKINISNVIPTRDDTNDYYYEFKNWKNTSTQEEFDPGKSVNFNENTTLKAQWNKIKKEFDKDGKEINKPEFPTYSYRTITFDATDGKIVSGKSSVKIQKGKKVGPLPIAMRSGYIFQGWYDKEDNIIANTTTFTENTTLTAKWKKTTKDDLNAYMDRNYIRTILYDELVSIPTDNGNSNMSYESDATIKSYMCSTGINQGWRMCNWFDPDYFARKMLSTYGVTFNSYKDAWECAIGFRNCRSVDEYIKIIKGTCEHDGGTTSDGKTCTFDTYVQAVTEDILVKSFIACGCGETFDDLQHHTMHEIYKEFEGDTTIHAYGPLDIHKTKVINPAYINHEHKTYCKNSGEIVSTRTTTSPWTGIGSGMPEDPCKHEYLLVNKGLDDQYEICRKCGERK